MKNGIKIAAIAVLAILAATLVAYAMHDDRPTLDATLVKGERSRLILDVTLEDMESIGAYFGCDLDVAYDGKHYTAVFTDSHSGVATFSMGVSYSERSSTISLTLSGGDLEKETGIGEGSTITLKVVGENMLYKLTPNYRAGSTDKRADYDDDQKFGNYRELSGGNLKEDTFYRSSNPLNYRSERAQYSDEYYRELEVENLISFDMSQEDLEKRCEQLPDAYATSVYEAGKFHTSVLSPSVLSHPDHARFVFESLVDTEGSVGIFCTFGKDRTGLYCAMIESLAGATYEEVRADFMTSMCNYYHFEKDTPEYYAVAHMYIDRYMWMFKNYDFIGDYTSVDWSKMNFDDYDPEEIITNYLINVCGLPPELIDAVKERIAA